MADALGGSFLNSGTDSTAELLAKMQVSSATTSAEPSATEPLDSPIAAAPAPEAVIPAPQAPPAPASASVVPKQDAPASAEDPSDEDPTKVDLSAEPSPADETPKAEAPQGHAPTGAHATSDPHVVPASLPEVDEEPAVQASAPDTLARSSTDARAQPSEPAVLEREESEAAPRPVSSRTKRSKEWAHKALNDSFLDNRINGQTWETFGYRLIPDVKARLEARVTKDKRSSGNRRLAQGHYLNVALLNAPKSTEARLKMITDFLRERGGVTEPGKPTNYRVSRDVYDDSRDLDMEITEAAKRGLVIFFFSAAVQSLLDELDREGELKKPEILRRIQ